MYRLRMFGPAMLIAILLIAGAVTADNLDLVRLLHDRPWLMSLRWDQHPGFNPHAPAPHHQTFDLHRLYDPQPIEWNPKLESEDRSGDMMMDNNADYFRMSSQKRSAVATALNAGRRRRQPAPALGKIIVPYAGVGVLNDMGMFFDSLRDNLEVLASLSPDQRASLLHDVPTVVQAPTSGSSGGSGMRRLHALRPLRPTGNIRSYNRRSFVEADGVYPGANNHDPGLLWTGLGRR